MNRYSSKDKMHLKFLIIMMIAANSYTGCVAALRRTPKVYNALITTDDNLSSSRAYPVIQPTIHETGVAHYPFGPFNPFGYYSPPVVRFGQPITPGLEPQQVPTHGAQLPYPLTRQPFPPQIMHGPPLGLPERFPGYAMPQQPPTAAAAADTMQQQQADAQALQKQNAATPTAPAGMTLMPIDGSSPQTMPNDKLPIPLNEFGLPPALIPLQQYPQRQGAPYPHMPPYGFNQYQPIYDPITGTFREHYLPPYEYYPNPHTYAVAAGPAFGGATTANRPTLRQGITSPNSSVPAEVTAAASESVTTRTTVAESQLATDANNFESIKNSSKSKNADVPDVPPPPIPSGAKSKQ